VYAYRKSCCAYNTSTQAYTQAYASIYADTHVRIFNDIAMLLSRDLVHPSIISNRRSHASLDARKKDTNITCIALFLHCIYVNVFCKCKYREFAL